MTLRFECHSCKCGIRIPQVGEKAAPMRFKWKDKTHMVKVHVCEACWSRAKSLKVD